MEFTVSMINRLVDFSGREGITFARYSIQLFGHVIAASITALYISMYRVLSPHLEIF